jgi:hypothetical protein
MKGLYIRNRQGSNEVVDYGVMKLSLYQENKKEIEKYFKVQQAVIENSNEILTKIQLPKEHGVKDQLEDDILKIDCFFKAYKTKKFKKDTILKTFKSLSALKTISRPKKLVEENPLVTRVNINNYKNHFEFSNNFSDYLSERTGCLNTDYNVTFKKSYPNDNDEAVTLANLVKKIDIKSNQKLEKLKTQRISAVDYRCTTMDTESSTKTVNSYYRERMTFVDVDRETTKFNSYARYKPKSTQNIDKVYKLNTLFDSFCKVEKKADELLLSVGNKLIKDDTFNYEEKLHGHKLFGNLNPIKVAKMNIKRLYH